MALWKAFEPFFDTFQLCFKILQSDFTWRSSAKLSYELRKLYQTHKESAKYRKRFIKTRPVTC